MAESDNILTKLHDLMLYLIPQLSKFPRDQKFVLGDRIETKLLEVQEQCLRAYYSRDKRGHLLEANLTLEVTRHLIRLAHGLKLFSNHTYGERQQQHWLSVCEGDSERGETGVSALSTGQSAPIHGSPRCPERKPTSRRLFPAWRWRGTKTAKSRGTVAGRRRSAKLPGLGFWQKLSQPKLALRCAIFAIFVLLGGMRASAGVAQADSADFILNTTGAPAGIGGATQADSVDFTLNTTGLSPGVYADSADFTLDTGGPQPTPATLSAPAYLFRQPVSVLRQRRGRIELCHSGQHEPEHGQLGFPVHEHGAVHFHGYQRGQLHAAVLSGGVFAVSVQRRRRDERGKDELPPHRRPHERGGLLPRAAGAVGELFPTLLLLQGARITDDAPNQTVVIGVGRIAEAFRETRVELVFVGPRNSRVRNYNSQLFQSRGGDENQQRVISDPTLRKIGETLFDKRFARQQ